MASHGTLISEEDKVYLIDFDYCIMDTRLHDITSLIKEYEVWNLGYIRHISY